MFSLRLGVAPFRNTSKVFTRSNYFFKSSFAFSAASKSNIVNANLVRSFHNYNKQSPSTKSITQKVNFVFQKRTATHSQLGRSTYREPKYNNVRNNILTPLLFATVFSVVAFFGSNALFTYTPLGYFKKHSDQLLYTIIGLNLVVFGLWQVRFRNAKLYQILEKYFILDRSALTRQTNWSMLGSTFSHQEPLHIFFNMLCLYSFSGSMISVMGVPGFTAFYLSAGVWASFASLAYSQLSKNFARSLGASGSIAGLFSFFSVIAPKAGISFFFIPIPGGASTAALIFAAYNIAGCIFRWTGLDYAAHLGGMAFGGFWAMIAVYLSKKKEGERRDRLRKYGF
ncbi:rhomboid protease [Martiniozyma asiatica (nom. inval.)]|nr:rhomboid protease [Martiniozyma asiatica]